MAEGGECVSYPLVKAAVMTLLGRVTGIPSSANLGHHPRTVHAERALSTTLDRFERSQSGQVTTMDYYLTSRLWVKWQDNGAAELEMEAFINRLPAEVDDDPTLGGACKIARIEGGNPGFFTVGGTLFRTLDFNWFVHTKAHYGSGI